MKIEYYHLLYLKALGLGIVKVSIRGRNFGGEAIICNIVHFTKTYDFIFIQSFRKVLLQYVFLHYFTSFSFHSTVNLAFVVIYCSYILRPL